MGSRSRQLVKILLTPWMAAEAVEAVSPTSVNRSIINNVKNEQCSGSGTVFWASRNRIRNHLYGSGSRSRQLVKIFLTPCMAGEAVEVVSATSVNRSIINYVTNDSK